MINIISIIIIFILLFFWKWLANPEPRLKKKSMSSKVNDWEIFTNQLLNWAKEIQDPVIRDKFIDYYQSIWTPRKLILFNKNYERRRLIRKWGKYIPSIISKNRNKKLGKLLK